MKSIQQQIEETERKLVELKKKQEDNKSEWLYIPELNIEVEIEVHDKGKSWDELGLSKREKELLTIERCKFLANNPQYAKILKMDGSRSNDDFFIQQPFNLNRKNGYVARFVAGSVRADLYCYWDPVDSCSSLGVRFVRKKISGKRR